MGYIATLQVIVDAANDIARDQEFGSKIAKALHCMTEKSKPINIESGGYFSAATILISHHNSQTHLISTSPARDFGSMGSNTLMEEEIFKNLAKKLNYVVIKKY